jgi:hypothetical protein
MLLATQCLVTRYHTPTIPDKAKLSTSTLVNLSLRFSTKHNQPRYNLTHISIFYTSICHYTINIIKLKLTSLERNFAIDVVASTQGLENTLWQSVVDEWFEGLAHSSNTKEHEVDGKQHVDQIGIECFEQKIKAE